MDFCTDGHVNLKSGHLQFCLFVLQSAVQHSADEGAGDVVFSEKGQ